MIFLDRGSAHQFFVAIFIALIFLVVDTFVRPYHDFRCNALKVLTSMSMLITLLCGLIAKLDWRSEIVSSDTLGWVLIVSGLRRIARTIATWCADPFLAPTRFRTSLSYFSS